MELVICFCDPMITGRPFQDSIFDLQDHAF